MKFVSYYLSFLRADVSRCKRGGVTDVKQLWLFSVSFPNAHLPKSVVLFPACTAFLSNEAVFSCLKPLTQPCYEAPGIFTALSFAHSCSLLAWCLEPKIRRLLNKYRSCTSLFNLQLRLRSALVFLDVIKRFEWSDAVLYNFGIGPWLKKWIVRNFSINSEFSIFLGSKRGVRDKI